MEGAKLVESHPFSGPTAFILGNEVSLLPPPPTHTRCACAQTPHLRPGMEDCGESRREEIDSS